MALAFKDSKANIAMYTEMNINDRLMNPNKKFNDRMRMKNPGSFSVMSYNINLGANAV